MINRKPSTMVLPKLFFPLFFATFAFRTSRARNGNTQSQPIARTQDANFIGSTISQYDVDSWAGIRYAKAPTGSLRLQPPEAIQNQGDIYAQGYGFRCFTVGTQTNLSISEDCLTLNIWAPAQSGYNARDLGGGVPVLLWIHGGGFNEGSGADYNGTLLVNSSME